jgi:hypothetical protein
MDDLKHHLKQKLHEHSELTTGQLMTSTIKQSVLTNM